MTQDRIAARFQDKLITLSDVEWLISFKNYRLPQDPEERTKLQRTILDLVIDLEIIQEEARLAPFLSVDEESVNEFIEDYRGYLPPGETLEDKLQRMGATARDLRAIVRRELLVEEFVKLRFEPFVVVSPREIQNYYTQELTPQFQAGDQEPPPLSLVEENIREILANRKKSAQLEDWVEKARRQIEISVLLFREPPRAPNLPKPVTVVEVQ
jgi:hypothetical protein